MFTEKILLACPTSDVKAYCQDEWIAQLSKFTYPNLDILIVENSETDENYKYLKSKGVNVVYAGAQLKGLNIRQKIFKCTQYIRNYVIKNKYDYWFSLESDIFVPENVVEHLVALNKQVVGIPYFHFSEESVCLLHMELYNIRGTSFVDYYSNDKSFLFCDGKVKQMYQNGFGCLLVHKDIVKNMKFIYEDTSFMAFPDYFFHQKLLMNDVPVYVDTSMFATHKNSNKRWAALAEKKEL